MKHQNARVRVEISKSYEERDRYRAFQKLLRDFKDACDEYGVQHYYREHEHFTREGDYQRRKRARRLKLAREGNSGTVQKKEEFNNYEY